MINSNQTTLYRKRVSALLQHYRNALFYKSGRLSYPTDASLAYNLGLSPTAFSSINRQCSSMSGAVLHLLLSELSALVDKDQFASIVSDFVS